LTELSYAELLDHLFPRLTGGIRWGLDRTRSLLGAVGDPHLSYPSIHVGGTNGKGSVAAIVESVLRHDGQRTGLYTSPHLVDFRERIQFNGRPISEADLLQSARMLWPRVEAEAPSFFEAATVIAFLAMERAGVDVAVVEVGMGGRLDSTNVLTPDVSIITNVALDHAQYLGRDLATIAGEKAGIIKPGLPVVTAAVHPPEVLAVLERRARDQGSPLHVVAEPPAEVDAAGTAVSLETIWGRLPLRLPLAGRHQATNLAVAVRALELLPAARRPSPQAVVEGVAATHWPGRFQIETLGATTWIFDVAHNAAGVESLVASLRDVGPARPLVALIGVLGDKAWGQMLPPLFAAVDAAILTDPPSAPAERRWDPESVLVELGSPPSARVVRPFAAAIAAATATAAGGTVLCAGSVHTVGDAMLALGIAPFPRDLGLQVEGGAA
jgi:dihydrofolate synthase / folylpolyglutamate synthase